MSLSDNNQTDIIETLNSTSRYLDDLLYIDNHYFVQTVGQIYPTELQLNKANSSDTEAPFLDLVKATYSFKNSGELLRKLKARDSKATSLSTYNFLLFTLLYLII